MNDVDKIMFFSSLLVVSAVVDPVDAPLLLPFKTLLSTVSSMTFSEGETQKLIEILGDKPGLAQDTWQLVCYSSYPHIPSLYVQLIDLVSKVRPTIQSNTIHYNTIELTHI